MAKKRKVSSSKSRVQKTSQGDYVEPKFILGAYKYLKPHYHLPPLEDFVRRVMSLKMPCPGMKFKTTRDGFCLSIPLTHVIKTLKLVPRI